MLQRTYDWMMAISARPNAIWALAVISFIESSVFPIPPDVLLVPMILAARSRWLVIALVCTVASVLGGLAGYAIGYFLYESVGRPLLDFYGYAGKFASLKAHFDEWGAWWVAMAGLTPFPYKVITIASGVFALDPATFSIASALSRGARFFLEAGLLYWVGPPIRSFVEKRLGLVTTVFFVILIGGFVVVRYLM